MRGRIRFAIVGAAFAASLAFAANALATQQLFVSQTATSVTFKSQQTQNDPQPAHITINVPAGYQLTTGQPVGTKIGTTTGDVFARDVGLPLPFTGDILVADPAHPPAAWAGCSSPPYLAIWNLHVVIGGAQTADLYFFVKQGAGPVAYTLETCLGPADTPQGSPNRSPAGSVLLDSTLTLNNVTAVPSQAVWTSFWTPYATGTGIASIPGTVEARAFVGDGAISLRAKVLSKKKHTVRVSGVVTQAGVGGVNGATVRLVVNHRARASKLSGSTGAFSFVTRVRGRKLFQAVAVSLARDITSTGCATPTAPPIPCVSATANAFTASSKAIRVKG